MEISKFKLQDTLLDLKDETARQTIGAVQVVAERAEGKADDAKAVADRAEGKAGDAQAVANRAEGKADDALEGLESKQDISTAWKIGTIEVREENVTINSLANHTFIVDVPTGVSNVILLNARSSDTTRALVPINLYVSNGKMNAAMSNQSSTTMNATMTISITYAYK